MLHYISKLTYANLFLAILNFTIFVLTGHTINMVVGLFSLTVGLGGIFVDALTVDSKNKTKPKYLSNEEFIFDTDLYAPNGKYAIPLASWEDPYMQETFNLGLARLTHDGDNCIKPNTGTRGRTFIGGKPCPCCKLIDRRSVREKAIENNNKRKEMMEDELSYFYLP